MSISTLGAVNYRDKSEPAAAAERRKARAYDDRTNVEKDLREKELEMREREIALREREIALQERRASGASAPSTPAKTADPNSLFNL